MSICGIAIRLKKTLNLDLIRYSNYLYKLRISGVYLLDSLEKFIEPDTKEREDNFLGLTLEKLFIYR